MFATNRSSERTTEPPSKKRGRLKSIPEVYSCACRSAFLRDLVITRVRPHKVIVNFGADKGGARLQVTSWAPIIGRGSQLQRSHALRRETCDRLELSSTLYQRASHRRTTHSSCRSQRDGPGNLSEGSPINGPRPSFTCTDPGYKAR